MSASDLATLRAEIDRIDSAMVDLLVERLAVVGRIAAAKGDRGDGRVAIRPAREALILRRLTGRAGAGFPKAALVRMWRELLAATTRAQAPLGVAIHVPPTQPGLWDLARDHMGSLTPMLRVESSADAVRAVADGRAQLAVLPLPDAQDPWWRTLLTTDQDQTGGPRIVARLPFGGGEDPAGEAAVLLARLDDEPSGDDRSILAIRVPAVHARPAIEHRLASAGLDPRWLASDEAGEAALHLLDLAGFVGDTMPAVEALLAHALDTDLRVMALGGYARPLSAAELA